MKGNLFRLRYKQAIREFLDSNGYSELYPTTDSDTTYKIILVDIESKKYYRLGRGSSNVQHQPIISFCELRQLMLIETNEARWTYYEALRGINP